jgi:hypothetical protein
MDGQVIVESAYSESPLTPARVELFSEPLASNIHLGMNHLFKQVKSEFAREGGFFSKPF